VEFVHDLPISRDLSLLPAGHLLLQDAVKDIKAAKTLDVVAEDSHPVVGMEAAVDVTVQHAPLVHAALKMKPLVNLITKSPNLPISMPTQKINMLKATMIPSALEFQSTKLLQVTMKPAATAHAKAHTLWMTVY